MAKGTKITSTFKGSGGTNWDKYVEKVKKNLISSANNTRDYVGNEMKATLVIPTEVMKKMNQLGVKMQQIEHLKKVFADNPQTQLQMSKAINDMLKALNKGVGLKGMGLQLDHADVNIVGLRLVGMYDAFTQILQDMGKEEKVVKIPAGSQGNVFKRSRKWVEDVIKEIQHLIALNKGMLNAYKSGKEMPPSMYEKLRSEYLGEIRYDLTATKQKFRDAANNVDGELMSLQIIDEMDNTSVKGGVESHTGQAATTFGGGMKKWMNYTGDKRADAETQKIIKDFSKDKMNIIGSKSIADELVKRTMGELTGKKYTPKKTTAKKIKSGRARTKYNKKSREQLRLQKESAAAIKAMATAAAIVSRTRPKKEGGDKEGLGQKELNKLKNQINKRLPAEVRRNMGFPQLTNRTGIFSNSAELISLRNTAGGISGTYTYTRTGGGTSKNKSGVYETFENTGSRRWRGSYNPKPLIAKSVRNLAIQYTKEKFTQLRRV